MTSVLFRADASAAIGIGHVKRCLASARGFADWGQDVAFATTDETYESYDALRKSDYRRYVARVPTDISNLPSGASEGLDLVGSIIMVWKLVASAL